jgi:hypothetical protein
MMRLVLMVEPVHLTQRRARGKKQGSQSTYEGVLPRADGFVVLRRS